MRALWLLVLCLIGGSAFAQAPPGAWWDASYQHRQQISIPAGASPLQTSYSVSFVFNHASHVNASPTRSLASGDDVRIVRWNSATMSWEELDRIIDPDTDWNTATTRLWFRTAAAIAQGTTDQNYYVYFNNPAAGPPPEDPDDVFLLYDTFSSGTAVDGARWNTTGTISVASGMARLDAGEQLRSVESFPVDTIWETRAKLTPANGQFQYWGGSSTVWFWEVYVRFQRNGSQNQLGLNNFDFALPTTQSVNLPSPNALHTYAFTREGTTTNRFSVDGAQLAQFTTSRGPPGNLFVSIENDVTGPTLEYDWVRIRSYRHPDPILSLGALIPGSAGPDHFLISHDGSGLNCAAEPITVTVRDSNNALMSTYAQQMTLDTGTGRGTWSLVNGSGTLTDTTANDGLATYVWPGNQSTAVFALSYPEGLSTFDIEVYQTTNSLLRDNDAAPRTITFSPSAFVLTSSALAANQEPPFPMMSSQRSGAPFILHIAKVGSTANGASCRLVNDYTGSKNLRVWSSYDNPNSGTRTVTLNSTVIATSGSDSDIATMNVSFDAGRATVSALYPDAGRITVNVRDQYEATLPTPVITQGSGSIVFRPNFIVSNIRQGSTPNPGAASAAGPKFIAAGSTFTADITAVTHETTPSLTPNFGRESPAESIRLVPLLVAPAGGAVPAITATATPVFVNGAAIGASFRWPEVGIIRVTPQIADGDYLSSGDVIGSMTGDIGRFVPADFAATANLPMFQTGCAAGAFTYIGQPFTYLIQPVVTVTARNVDGVTTTNYRDDFFKLTGGATVNRTYQPAANLDLSELPDPSADAVLAKGLGTGTLTFASGTGIAYSRTTPIAPFSANVSLQMTIRDSDDVAYASNPFVIGAGTGIDFSNGTEQRYGRVTLRNQVGSELIHLNGRMQAEYFDTNGFQLNAQDACTTGVTLQLSGPIAGQTCVIDGVSCVAGAPVAQRFRQPPVPPIPAAPTDTPGDFNLWLRAPGAGNSGAVTVSADVPDWLKYDWNTSASSPGLENPSANFVFGIYPGVAPNRIYQREAIVR